MANGISAKFKQVVHMGDNLSDGWIVGPVSPETGNIMAFEPSPKSVVHTWYVAEDHAKELRREGHRNARLPSKDEWSALLNANFRPGYKCWSSSGYPGSPSGVWLVYPDTGSMVWAGKPGAVAISVCVRDEPNLTLVP
jgi:hypothetical protein